MVEKECVVCGNIFDAKKSAITCSEKCSKENEKQKAKKYRKRYYKENKEKEKQKARQYYQKNKERINKARRQYRQKYKKIKNCVICGKQFEVKGPAVTCSEQCSKENKKRITKKWSENNKEYLKKKKRKWYENNKEYAKECSKQWREDHPEYAKEYSKQWREDHPEYTKEYSKQWRENHPEYQTKRDYQRYKQGYENLSKKSKISVNDLKKYLPPIFVQREFDCWEYGSYFLDFYMIAYRRANGICEITGKKTNDLFVHHLNGYNWCIEGRMDFNNIVVICRELHDAFHKKYGYGNNTAEQFWEFVEEWKKGIVTLDDFKKD